MHKKCNLLNRARQLACSASVKTTCCAPALSLYEEPYLCRAYTRQRSSHAGRISRLHNGTGGAAGAQQSCRARGPFAGELHTGRQPADCLTQEERRQFAWLHDGAAALLAHSRADASGSSLPGSCTQDG